MRLRQAAVVAGTAVLGIAAVPTIAEGVQKAQQVLIANGTDQPVPTKAVGTTTVAGDVSVRSGVAITGQPTVRLAAGTTVATTAAPPERSQLRLSVENPSDSGSQCSPVEVPDGKRLVLDSSLWEMRGVGSATPNAWLDVTQSFPNAATFDQYGPEPTGRGLSSTTGRLEGPFVLGGNTSGKICAGPRTLADVWVTGTLEPAS